MLCSLCVGIKSHLHIANPHESRCRFLSRPQQLWIPNTSLSFIRHLKLFFADILSVVTVVDDLCMSSKEPSTARHIIVSNLASCWWSQNSSQTLATSRFIVTTSFERLHVAFLQFACIGVHRLNRNQQNMFFKRFVLNAFIDTTTVRDQHIVVTQITQVFWLSSPMRDSVTVKTYCVCPSYSRHSCSIHVRIRHDSKEQRHRIQTVRRQRACDSLCYVRVQLQG